MIDEDPRVCNSETHLAWLERVATGEETAVCVLYPVYEAKTWLPTTESIPMCDWLCSVRDAPYLVWRVPDEDALPGARRAMELTDVGKALLARMRKWARQ